jgi:hypothetical protein
MGEALAHTIGREGNRFERDAVVGKVHAPQRATLNRTTMITGLLVFCLSSVA